MCHLDFRMLTLSSTSFASFVCDVCWLHRVPRVFANHVCHLRFRMVTSSSTSSCKPFLWRTFQDGDIEFHKFLQTLSVTCVSGWLHRVPRVFASAVRHFKRQRGREIEMWVVVPVAVSPTQVSADCRGLPTLPVPVQLSLFASVSSPQYVISCYNYWQISFFCSFTLAIHKLSVVIIIYKYSIQSSWPFISYQL